MKFESASAAKLYSKIHLVLLLKTFHTFWESLYGNTNIFPGSLENPVFCVPSALSTSEKITVILFDVKGKKECILRLSKEKHELKNTSIESPISPFSKTAKVVDKFLGRLKLYVFESKPEYLKMSWRTFAATLGSSVQTASEIHSWMRKHELFCGI